MENAIEVENLTHRFGRRTICENLNFEIPAGKVFGLLGKNGVGKTTLIKILMGFLRPTAGRCKVFGEDSHDLSPATRARIGLLFEGHLTYEFMTISQLERFYAPFYPKWDRDRYYRLVEKLGLSHDRPVGKMSCGQRSQVVLGLLMAQQPELLILDDYSMGLDAGYRRLFLDYMGEYLKDGERTVFLTSHVIQDMEQFVDRVIFLERGGGLLSISLERFMRDFRCYRLPWNGNGTGNHASPIGDLVVKNVETHSGHWDIFSFCEESRVADALYRQGFDPDGLAPVSMSLEDAFIGYTGRY
jgi:ABC-2 type transport system ATP-binding protein